MNYKNYYELESDLEYYEDLKIIGRGGGLYRDWEDSGKPVSDVVRRKLYKIWLDRVNDKYLQTASTNTIFGRFIKQFPVPLKEFRVLIDLIDDIGESPFSTKNEKDVFRKYRVRYESSKLRRFKLVFKISNPRTPLKHHYEVSYKAQLALKGKKYTEEYEQLDMALEEDSNKNNPDTLDSLYYAIMPKISFKDIVLNKETIEQLKSALAREKKKDKIFKSWGLGKTIDYGRGTTLNFRGPPGTGKTMAANCLAKELDKKLLMVRYDQLQSMWIGETEKHIQRVFKLAKVKKAVLFFDEADAIALSRSSLERSWEMSQVNTLLKELERYEGVCIFATNFAEKYDQAFERRLTMHIDFNLPTKEQAIQILDKVLPKKARGKNLSLNNLNIDKLSGGDIKNIALNAAGIAAKHNSDKIKRGHIEEAIRLTQHKSKMNIGFIG